MINKTLALSCNISSVTLINGCRNKSEDLFGGAFCEKYQIKCECTEMEIDHTEDNGRITYYKPVVGIKEMEILTELK
jgi:hypothetical protein